jgi:hypothetical protein
MKKLNVLSILTVTVAMSLPLSVMAADPQAKTDSKIEYKDNGGYEAKASSSQDMSDGTKTTRTSKVDVDVDNDGEVTEKTKEKASADPKGLMNKKKHVITSKVDNDREDGEFKKTTKSDYSDNDGTNVSDKSTVKAEVDNDGNVRETVKNERVTDPKGLFNRKKTTSTTKRVNGEVVKSDTDTDR